MITLIVLQLLFIPLAAALCSFALRRRPEVAHTIAVAGLVASIAGPLMTLVFHGAGIGLFSQTIDTTASTNTVAAIEASVSPRPTSIAFWPIAIAAVWAAISLFALTRLIAGLRQSFRVARSAEAVPHGTATALNQLLPRSLKGSVHFAYTDELRAPAICCWCRPSRLLFPRNVLSIDPDMLRVVVRHEVAHLQRRDHVWRLIAEIVPCILPWHPAVWWLRAMTNDMSEQACDARAIADANVAAPQYAEALLHFVAGNSESHACRTPRPALHGFCAARRLSTRVEAALRADRTRAHLGRLALVSIVAASAGITTISAALQSRPASINLTTSAADFAVVSLDDVVDVGIVEPRSTTPGRVRLANVGQQSVTILDTKASCGCTQVSASVGRVLAPGDIIDIEFTLDAPDTPSTDRVRTITFILSDHDPLPVTIRLTTTDD